MIQESWRTEGGLSSGRDILKYSQGAVNQGLNIRLFRAGEGYALVYTYEGNCYKRSEIITYGTSWAVVMT